MSTTQTYTMRSPLATPTSGSGSITLSPSLATSTSLSTSSSMASPSISTSTSTTSAARVRFDAECVLIPELGSFNPKRPRMVTKSYSLPLWKKNTRDEEDEQHVVLKVALPRNKLVTGYVAGVGACAFSFPLLVLGFFGGCSVSFPCFGGWDARGERVPRFLAAPLALIFPFG
ncbi:hypothetical protein K438DRAFT_874883 [Mycena galopus ATCC 62051]|nr:hypothetical protein K438DRAFT_874883 [Mycena galopus ATCC 62051]